MTGTQALAAKSNKRHLLVGTTGSVSKGIYAATWDAATGQIGPMSLAAELANPSFLAIASNHLYACSEVDQGMATAFFIPSPGALRPLNSQSAEGGGTTFISARGNGVFVANYGTGSITSFHTGSDGALSPAVSHFQYTGSGPDKARQSQSHAHSALPSPDGRFLLVNDLGLDRIVVYRIDPDTAALTPNNPPFFAARAAVGPRHLAWHPNRKWLYSVNELDSTVDLLHWDNARGVLTQADFVSTLGPEVQTGTGGAGEIAISPDGRFVYVGNRVASETIAVLSVDPRTGALHPVEVVPNGGKNTRFLTLDPTGRWMLLCNQASNELVVLARDPRSGKLSDPKQRVPLNKPQCIVFAG